MKYHETLIVLICLVTIYGILTSKTELELLETGLMSITSIIVVLIAYIIHCHEGNNNQKK